MLQTEVVIYTDGACDPNPGPGGWAAVLLYEKDDKLHKRELAVGVLNTTNNRMEITAVLEALRVLKRPCCVTVYSDSQYVVRSIGSWVDGQPRTGRHGWMVGWRERGWSKKDGELKNVDLWTQVWDEVKRHRSVNLVWIRGHTGDEHNERCDFLAVAARRDILNATNRLPGNGLRQDGTADHLSTHRPPNTGQCASGRHAGQGSGSGDGDTPI